MRMKKWTAALAVMGMVGLAACDSAPEAEPQQPPAAQPEQPQAAPPEAAPTGPLPEGVTPEMVSMGQQVFTGAGNCFTCHGMDGTGTPLAPDLTDDQWLNLQPAQGDLLGQIENLVRTGVASPVQYPAPMPPMGGGQLTDEQVRAVAAYTLSLSGGQ